VVSFNFQCTNSDHHCD